MPLSSYISDSFSFDDFSSESNNASMEILTIQKKGAVVEDSWFYSILFILVVSTVIFQVLRYIRKKIYLMLALFLLGETSSLKTISLGNIRPLVIFYYE